MTNSRSIEKITRDDIGCWADGAGGHQHIRNTMARVLTGTYYGTDKWDTVSEVCRALWGEMSDDASEELDALEYLNFACDEGLAFDLFEGDLMLQTIDWFWVNAS